MSNRYVTYSFAAALIGAAAFALLRDGQSDQAIARAVAPAATWEQEPGDHVHSDLPPSDHVHSSPGVVANSEPMSADELSPPDDPPAITWKVPSTWKTAPNPTSLRIATYKTPHAPADAVDADVSVVRAGGAADDNIERWRGQFEGKGEEIRGAKIVRGFKVTIVELRGTYLGGNGVDGTRLPGWTLVGAIVETPGLPYFFKLTGPNATVLGARPAFEALVESISPG